MPLWLKVALIVFLVTLVFLLSRSGEPVLPYAIAHAGEFIVDLRETGRLRAENSVTVTAPPVRMNLQIIDMVEEGTSVEKGDFLIQFDTTEIGQQIDDRMAELDIAKSNLTSNLASMASHMASLKSSLENSLASHRLAELRLEQMEYEADVRIEEGKLNLKQAEISLAQSHQQVKSQHQIDSADVRSLELKIRQAQLDVQKGIRDKSRLTIKAPAQGMVIYKEMWKGGEMTKVKIGDTPWRGAALIELPDLSVMLVETSVNEVDISKVEEGQDVEIKLDAYPDPTYHGKVIDVAVLASQEEGISDAKVFKVLVRIDESDKLLRPGMSATVRIICDKIDDQIWIPIEAVFELNNEMIAWKAAGSGWKPAKVELGDRNDNFVIVNSGLTQDDKVALIDPRIANEEELQQQEETVVSPNNHTNSENGGLNGKGNRKFRVNRKRR